METQFIVPSMSKVHTVYVDAAAVHGERKPVLLKDPKMTVDKYESLIQDRQLDVVGAMTVDLDYEEENEMPTEQEEEAA
jgi:hypothetical protein